MLLMYNIHINLPWDIIEDAFVNLEKAPKGGICCH